VPKHRSLLGECSTTIASKATVDGICHISGLYRTIRCRLPIRKVATMVYCTITVSAKCG